MRARHPALHFALVAAPLVILLLALGQWWDTGRELYAHFSALRQAQPGAAGLMRLWTDWGNALFYVVYGVILWRGWRTGDRVLVGLALAFMVVQLLVALGLVHALKHMLGRPRPDVDGLPMAFSSLSRYHSLPSGHTTEFAGAALGLALWRRNAGLSVFLGLLLALMGFSRVYLGAHHVSDVALGLALGSWSGWAIHCFRPRGPDD